MYTISLVLLVAGPIFANSAGDAIDDAELREILRSESARFHDRPDLLYLFESEYNLHEGSEGPHASLRERRSGEVRWGGDGVETFLTDTFYDPDSEWADEDGFRPAREKQRVWKDGRTLGLRVFVNPAFERHEQPFTTKAKVHDGVSPDNTGWFVDGIIVDSDHYADSLLQSLDLKGVIHTGDGGETRIRVEGTTPKGRMTAWLDTEAPHLLRRARFEASPDYVSALGGLDEAGVEVSVDRYAEVDGVPIAAEGIAIYSYTLNSTGERLKKMIATKRSDFLINPDFKPLGAFSIDFPDDTLILSYDAANVRYLWSQSELRPYVDE